eukprot:scpid61268/ scgid4977/ Arabinose 5-phosphate isomerase KdsD; Pa-KdsD
MHLVSLGRSLRPLRQTLYRGVTRYSRSLSSPGPKHQGRVALGCGSNVVDSFYMVKALPRPGEKGFFQDPTKVLEAEYVGGVTLNHLCWAQLLGTPTGLLALQGTDHHGKLIRQELDKMGVATKFIEVKDSYTTAQSLVFVEEGGERSIIMAKGATSQINKEQVAESFGGAIASSASLVSTEISQVPLSGVLELIRLARENGIPSVVDLDVSPDVAVHEALLGTKEEFVEVCRSADVLKPARHAAEGALKLIAPHMSMMDIESMDTMQLSALLRQLCDSRLIAMTDGLAPSCFVTESHAVSVAPVKLDRVVDATGAGDAFLGGLIATMNTLGKIPSSREELTQCGTVANRLGSACCRVLGAVPTAETREHVQDLIVEQKSTSADAPAQPSTGEASASKNFHPTIHQSLLSDIEAVNSVIGSTSYARISELSDKLIACRGSVLVSGVGKSGLVARRLAATLSSISVPCEFVHATEFHHGDLGKVSKDSIVMLVSHSGNTAETVALCDELKQRGASVVALTSNPGCLLGRQSCIPMSSLHNIETGACGSNPCWYNCVTVIFKTSAAIQFRLYTAPTQTAYIKTLMKFSLQLW